MKKSTCTIDFELLNTIEPNKLGWFDNVPKAEHFDSVVDPLILRGQIPKSACAELINANKGALTEKTKAPRGKNGAGIIVTDYRNDDRVINPNLSWLKTYFSPDVYAKQVNEHWGVNYAYKHIKDFPHFNYSVFTTGQYCREHPDVLMEFLPSETKIYRPLRRLTALVYLSSWSPEPGPGTFQGGELIFSTIIDKYGNRFSFRPQAGDAIIFPSTPYYYHLVATVTGGARHTSVSFLDIKHE